ncbi:carboxylating nicotinate-nucleotide diphosphorylase [Fusobacterium mortiferum]|jgi:nicotinate-nucleotide pyrophosphorylase (carboxylating)|uniref:nicotinate-nucleotide diphosphorylase (carboxylating) n=1 Tax=Fusobacterium mortiferum ATCC 9817 TaxID=469616 RepID=A0ABN5JA32_FUSMR|nr:carboxylating nicotinate-nucleotide diphosphorylase [Fusobacterium mortiferum]AVQ18973.1 nicotinate-nucleotide diphosphorylase (carboxylating) [Fusobacterium mortiferum ATCC 9817]MCF2626808.1 carboxylating nicotinate-nucleotide diphosphorylase [Fusobacterium mortiferum]MCF2698105.1 carboxylating nicotinate-nucleotide diphosphorylase [Fusobacterium mortiferum]MCI7666183.1 carboxylating nicotinate-nucleotide diphosphorylase [Fusobacterium mortiferum]MDY2800289.1 carboxylating nicotinate-nucle
MNLITDKINVDNLILMALREDVSNEDITTNSIISEKREGKVQLICKEDGILAGIEVFKRVFQLLDENIKFSIQKKDGEKIKNKELIGEIYGDVRAILTGERTALNYLQHMSGIATYTNNMVELLKGSNIKLLDTRKTTPNMRIFDKYSVKIGGGYNHRYNLSDGILIKDNHIDAAGSITKAIKLAKEYAPFVRKIEVEVENLDMVAEALEAGVDIIMLDNMSPELMRTAVKLIAGRAETECSGNISKESIEKIKDTGVDYISSGALTHSAPILDFSLKHLQILK